MERNSAKSTYIYSITALKLILYEITLKISLHMCIMWLIASVVIYEIDGEKCTPGNVVNKTDSQRVLFPLHHV